MVKDTLLNDFELNKQIKQLMVIIKKYPKLNK